MFDDRLAVIACLVYALHGKLIAISPLIIRDSTFWFLLVLTLYFVWRAVGELRIGLFLAAGRCPDACRPHADRGLAAADSVAGLGGLPLVHRQGNRLRLVVGTLLCIAVIPAAVTVGELHLAPRAIRAGNSSARPISNWPSIGGIRRAGCICPLRSRDHACPRRAWFRQRFRRRPAMPIACGEARCQNPTAAFASILVPAVVPPEQTTPSWNLTFKLLERLAKGCTWVGSVLLLVGLACGWRIFLRPEHLTLFGMNLLLLVDLADSLRDFGPRSALLHADGDRRRSLDGLGPGLRHRRVRGGCSSGAENSRRGRCAFLPAA